jgi:hypothetical protein
MEPIGVAEIKDVILQCQNCERTYSYGPEPRIEVPLCCSACRHPWSHVERPYIEKNFDPLFTFLNLIRVVKETERTAGFRILFKFY